MPVQLGSEPLADFNQPLRLMMDCHRRIEHFITVLLRVVDLREGAPVEASDRDALRTALDYFERAAPRHTEDEEHSLFPRMRESADPAVAEALRQIDALERDHREAELNHERVDVIGRRWLDRNELSSQDVEAMRVCLVRLRDAYAAHIRIEDERVFPLAERTLSAEEFAAIGAEMRRRREIDPGRPGSRCAERRTQRSAAATPPPPHPKP